MDRKLILLLSAFSLLFYTFPSSNAHNITSILDKYPKFSSFNHYLTTTGLAEEINHGMALTVCVVDNPTLRHFLTKFRPSTNTLRHILSLHVLLDYYGRRKLHRVRSNTLVPTLFSDNNHLIYGYPSDVHISGLKGGKVVKFSVTDNMYKKEIAYFISSIEGIAYNISVIQISGILSAPRAKPKFSTVLSTVMNNNFCKLFREKLSGTLAEKIYMENVKSGLTIFCPTDFSFRKFLPRFEKLSEEDKNALLLFHAVPIYMSLYMIREANGRYETLVTYGPNRYGLVVENGVYGLTYLKTKVMETMIDGRFLDDQPLSIYGVDEVLFPEELLFDGEMLPEKKVLLLDGGMFPKKEVSFLSSAAQPYFLLVFFLFFSFYLGVKGCFRGSGYGAVRGKDALNLSLVLKV